MEMREINAKGIYYRDLNQIIRSAIKEGEKDFILKNVNGQRYIVAGVDVPIKMEIYGTPGQDLGAFMKGPYVRVHGNAQDGVGNTMDEGKIVIEGSAGDVVGYAMRGGKIYIQGDVGYRVGIHMKAFKEKVPVIVIGGKAGDFLGEYMAGGIIILLGMFSPIADKPLTGICLGTGMHGGVIYIRGQVSPHLLGNGLSPCELTEEDRQILHTHLSDYCNELQLDLEEILQGDFCKVVPVTHRPYGNLYAY